MKLSILLANGREDEEQLRRLDQLEWGNSACLVIQPNLKQTGPDHLADVTKRQIQCHR